MHIYIYIYMYVCQIPQALERYRLLGNEKKKSYGPLLSN